MNLIRSRSPAHIKQDGQASEVVTSGRKLFSAKLSKFCSETPDYEIIAMFRKGPFSRHKNGIK